jgi:hypothetical protein
VRAWVAHLLILAYLMYFALALNHNFAALIVHIISISTPKKNEVTRKFGMSFCRRPCVRLPARPLTWHHPIFTLAAHTQSSPTFFTLTSIRSMCRRRPSSPVDTIISRELQRRCDHVPRGLRQHHHSS